MVSVLIFGAGIRPDEALTQARPAPDKPRFAPDRVLVKLKGDAPAEAVDAINRKNGARTEKKLPYTRVSVVKLPKGLQVADAVRRYEASPDVEYAEPDFLLSTDQATSPTPNDTDYPKLYNLNNTGQTGGAADSDIDASEAWGSTTGSPDAVVAVIDTGVDIDHPDLKDNVWTNADEVPGNRVDDDKNGYTDDVHGWDFRNEDASVFDADEGSHGTYVAGVIAAEGNNGIGITGVNWRTSVMPLKFVGPDGGYVSDSVEAINYALAEGVGISNNSYGCAGCFSQTQFDAIKRADAAGHLYVASAGNGGGDTVGDDNDTTPHYPDGYDSPNIISVAATDYRDALAGFSNYGAASVDLAAPGVNILSTLPRNTYGVGSGTSIAAPHVTGVAALLKSKLPASDDAQLKDQILRSVDKRANLAGKTGSGGRLNAAAALGVGAPPPPAPSPAPPPAPAPAPAPAPNSTPTITSPRPTPGSATRDRTPSISAIVRDTETDLVKANVAMYVDGRRVTTFSYSPYRDKLTYTPRNPLSAARHTVRVIARDAQGVSRTYTWRFRVAG